MHINGKNALALFSKLTSD